MVQAPYSEPLQVSPPKPDRVDRCRLTRFTRDTARVRSLTGAGHKLGHGQTRDNCGAARRDKMAGPAQGQVNSLSLIFMQVFSGAGV